MKMLATIRLVLLAGLFVLAGTAALLYFGRIMPHDHTAPLLRAVTSVLPSLAVLAVLMASMLVVARVTARYNGTKRALGEYRELFGRFSEGVRDHAIIFLDEAGKIKNWNRGAERLQGFTAKEMLHRPFSRLFPDEDVRAGKPDQLLAQACSAGRGEEIGWRIRKDRTPFLSQCVVTPLRNEKGGIRGYSVLTRDITELRRSERMLQKLSASVEQAADLVVITDREGAVEFVNRAVVDITGYTREEFLNEGFRLLGPVDRKDDMSQALRETVHAGRTFESTIMTSKKSGEVLYLDAVATPIKDAGGAVAHVIFTGTDVTRVKDLKERLDYLASYDVVTALPNRSLFVERLGRNCSQAGAGLVAVLAIDIDRFKLINEIYGFDTGNNVLKQVAESLSVSVSKGDTVARLGSDEFGVILHDIEKPADVVLFVKMIMKNVPQIVMTDGQQVTVTLAIGIALYPNDGTEAQELLKNADTALARTKSAGRNSYQFYTPAMNVGVSELVFMERRLVDALKNKEYVLSYQPYCHLANGAAAGMEALIKWKNEEYGLVSPSKFIPMLEETGMIIDVGKWVLRTACRQLKEWGNGSSRLPVSVNLSFSQFRHDSLVEMVERSIRDFHVDPRRLTLEITESIFMKDMDLALSVLKRLKGLGVLISIDDFGTGYSSLSYLKRFPVDIVKIDQSFVKDVTVDPDTTSLVMGIINMAHSLNLKTIAEGVETEEQWKILRLLKCDMGQGYYFSPAMPPAECGKFLASAS